MRIEFVPYGHDLVDAVRDFNCRMRAGGSFWGFYESSVPDWIPERPGQGVWREYYLAIEDGAVVRGAYCLKPQKFLCRGKKAASFEAAFLLLAPVARCDQFYGFRRSTVPNTITAAAAARNRPFSPPSAVVM